MKVYIVAVTSEKYMMPVENKVYKNKKAANKKCNALQAEGEKCVVLCADNWHKEEI